METEPFSSLRKIWKKVLPLGQDLNFRKGQVLFYEGHTPYGIFVILWGEVKLIPATRHCDVEFWDSPNGKVLGISHLFSASPLCCTAVAESDCRVLFLSKTTLKPFFPFLQKESSS